MKFVIFDMDGTLVDSELCSAQALCDVWPEIPMTAEAMNNEYRGVRFAAKLAILSERFDMEIPEGTEQKLRDREVVLGETMITVNPGVVTVLSTLVERGINFCIASNAPTHKTMRNAGRCGIDGYLENRAVYSAHDLKAWKPSPEMFLHAANTEGVTSEQCLVVEDSKAGIKAGIAAGMTVVAYDSHGDLTSIQNDLVKPISDFEKVLDFL
uniref:Haloacid dehalogenase n=1 Tax=uncultured Thiotrichaceae bacterium TaxID=298394 RepID=A0A6S6UK03_9GAMM|nr:MAG: Haloacid dehalogenase [uncultured Thiotrichaceae bacterium]